MTADHAKRLQEVRDSLQRQADGGIGGPGQVWRDIAVQVRAALVSLSFDTPAGVEPEDFARRPWASYSVNEQIKIGALARLFVRELSQAGALR